MIPPAIVVPQLVVGVPTASKDCGPAGGATIVFFVSYGEIDPSAYDVRREIEPPDWGPTNVGQIAQALRSGWGIPLRIEAPDTFDELWAWLKASPRRIATVYIQYSVLRGTPLYASNTGFGGAHTITVTNPEGSDERVLEADPLADGKNGHPLGPLWITKTLLRRACGYVFVTRNGNRVRLGVGLVIVGYAEAPEPPEDEPEIGVDGMDNLFPDTFLSYALDLPVGTKFYEDPALTVLQGKVTTPDLGHSTKTFGLLGAPIGLGSVFRVANGDRGVFVKRTTAMKPRRLEKAMEVGR